MKGYEMVLVVNGIIFLILGALTLVNGYVLSDQGERCPQGNATQCEREGIIGETTRRVAPFLFVGGLILLGVGFWLVDRRKKGPPQEAKDEGPEYL